MTFNERMGSRLRESRIHGHELTRTRHGRRKEIRNKIKSVQNTRKITKAMEMVAASKMRKAQERMRAARPYVEKIRNVIGAHRARRIPNTGIRSWSTREQVKRVGTIVVTTDKGLCGGLNTNCCAWSLQHPQGMEGQGQRSRRRRHRQQGRWASCSGWAATWSRASRDLGDRPHLDKLIGAVKIMLDEYMRRPRSTRCIVVLHASSTR